ncbi:S-layer homology domain-containing protein [Actinomarinicola tropica]|uniref:S-layer homology domain-containing protein n=1 Tax=Actinomarinicola tropica TaxID=2789776 RepID=A0A5Q2RLU4_9ACTN|nr:S-layer homology domain-containing protein [Actinomarinicola tropica]QGG96454.1 hypothetical protein GH723_15845 [Actinomarinicola tropica]
MAVRHVWRPVVALVVAVAGLALAPGGAAVQAAPTDVSGTLPTGLTSWTPDESPYELSGPVTVPAGGTLYVAPGTVVTSTDPSHGLVVEGRLRASAATFDLAGGIVVDSAEPLGAGDHHLALDITTVRGAAGAAVQVDDGSVRLADVTITDSGAGLVGGPDADPILVSRSQITHVSGVADVDGELALIDTYVAGGFTTGIHAGEVTMVDSVVEDTIDCGPGPSPAPACAIVVTSSAGGSIDGSWLGSDDPVTLAGFVWDQADDATLGAVSITAPESATFDAQPPTVTVNAPEPQLPAQTAQLTGDAIDDSGVLGPAAWVFNATDRTVWNEDLGQWVAFAPFEESQLAYAGSGTSDWTLDLPTLEPSKDYFAVVVATESFVVPKGQVGRLGASNAVAFRTFDPPTAPTITGATTGSDGRVTFTWTAASPGDGPPVDEYRLSCVAAPTPPLAVAERTATTSSLTASVAPALGVRTSCTVRAVSDAGTGPASAPRVVRVATGAPTFSDTPGGTFFTAAVGWAQAAGLTTGVGGTDQFQPHRAITRAEVITLLWRHAGSPTGAPAHGFDDTTPSAFYDRALSWARNDSLTTGVGGTNQFQPDRPITRAETITLLWRYAGSPTGAPAHGFDDTTPSAFYDRALSWARNDGLTTGVGGTNQFQPDRPITRAETITLLWRAATN